MGSEMCIRDRDKTPALRHITASLIERGDVYKTGERRSTRYFLTATANGAGHATAEAYCT